MKHNLLLPVVVILAMCVTAGTAFAFENKLKNASNKTVVDGTIHKNEYSYAYTFQDMELYLNKNGGNLYIAASVKTDGWISVGFNSNVMNNAYILIGYVENGAPVFKEQEGAAHKHVDTDMSIVQSYKIKESRGSTVLEVGLKERDVIKNGKENLEMILAYGEKDSFKSYHGKTRIGISVPLE